MNKLKLLPLLAVLLLISLTGCASLLNLFAGDTSSSPASGISDPLDGYVFAYVDGLEGRYHSAKIIKPASADTKNQAEVLDMSNGSEKRWAKVFTSHPAVKSELAVGEVVLVQDSGFSDPDKDTLIATTWTASYITDTSDLYKGEVKVGNETAPIKHLRIPDTEIVTR